MPSSAGSSRQGSTKTKTNTMIKRYNESNARLRKGQQLQNPTVSFTTHGGVIRLNRRLSEMLEVKPTDKVEIMHDEEAGEWYIAKSPSGLSLSNAGRGSTQMHSRVLMEAIAPYLPESASKTATCTVASIANTLEGLECYAILGLVQP